MSLTEAVGRVAELKAMLSPPAVAPAPAAPATPATSDFSGRLATAQARASTAAPAAPGATNPLAGVPAGLAPLIRDAAAKAGVDPALVAAVARAESGFDPTAGSPAGAQGLMQLMPGTARGLGVTDPFDAAQSLAGGARYLRQQLDAFGGDVRLALAAYNAGPGAVRAHGGVPPYSETQAYVPKVMGYLDELRSTGALAGP